MVDIELVYLAITSLLFGIGWFGKIPNQYGSFFKIGFVGSTIDLIIHGSRLYFYALPTVVNVLDFAFYYIYYSLLFYLLWYNSEKLPDERLETVGIFLTSLTIMLSFLYVFTVDEIFVLMTLLVFTLHGLIMSFVFTVNQFGEGWGKVVIITGGIILILGMFLYPTFIISARLFFVTLLIYYIGWTIILIHLISLGKEIPVNTNTNPPASMK